MGKLERAKIYVLKDDGSDSGKKDDPTDGIEVCFNPKEYSLEKQVSWDSEKAFSDAPQPEFTKPSAMTLSVTLQFDTYEERVSVRDKYVKKIEKLSMMRAKLPAKPKKEDKKKASPPVIVFVWGRFTFKGVIESLSQKYTMFLADGTPVRAECAIKIRNVWDTSTEDDKGNFKASAAASKSYTVKQGDRLDSIAAEQMGDASRWPEIAAENNLDDPVKDVHPGQNLKIPQ
jgi:LysM repeat protein